MITTFTPEILFIVGWESLGNNADHAGPSIALMMGRGLVRPLALPVGKRQCLHVRAKCRKRTGKVRDTSKKRKIACAFVSRLRSKSASPTCRSNAPRPRRAWRKYARDRVARWRNTPPNFHRKDLRWRSACSLVWQCLTLVLILSVSYSSLRS